MKERPILFSGEMVRAILEERKSQTRRVIKPRKPFRTQLSWYGPHPGGGWWGSDGSHDTPAMDRGFPCPYGAVGDRLWVRETWGIGAIEVGPKGPAAYIAYKADGTHTPFDYRTDCRKISLTSKPEVGLHSPDHWRPSIHMPRWASRITLEITGVRVEKVQEISERDAEAEGIDCWEDNFFKDYSTNKPSWFRQPIASYQTLWDSINAKRGFGWDSNPWVWVIEFKRVQP